MGATQHTVGTANVRAYCTLLLADRQRRHAPGTGANIFRGHCQRAGRDRSRPRCRQPAALLRPGRGRLAALVARLGGPLRLLRLALRRRAGQGRPRRPDRQAEHGGFGHSRPPAGSTPRCCPAEQVDQKDNIKGDVRHGSRRQHHSARARRGGRASESSSSWWWSTRIRPTSSRSATGATAPTSCRPARNFECDGSRTASNRSIQWGEKVVEPIFESANDYWIMYKFAQKLGFASEMFKNIKMVKGKYGDEPEAESLLREINRGGWSTGYTGQSPERIKAHMANQDKFDIVTLRAPKELADIGGDYYGLPWPCWGTAGGAPSRHAHPLQHQPAHEGRRRRLPRPASASSAMARPCWRRSSWPTSTRRSRTATRSSPMPSSSVSAGTPT